MIHTIRVEGAESFVDHLRLTHPAWQIDIPGDTSWQLREKWGFRGQKDTHWGLVPSAFRRTTELGYKGKEGTGPGRSGPPPLRSRDQQQQERRALVDFLFFADRVGLNVPGDGQHFRTPELAGHPARLELESWPWEHALETLAVAQHHGVPTRLIDFSHSPMIAAFFACYDAWKEMARPSIHDKPDHQDRVAALWAIDLQLIVKSVGVRGEEGRPPRVIMVTAPRSENAFLHHQEGFFVVDLESDRAGYPDFETVLQKVREEVVAAGHESWDRAPIVKLELAWKHVPETLARLWNEHYNIARLMPTHDNAVRALEDHRALYS